MHPMSKEYARSVCQIMELPENKVEPMLRALTLAFRAGETSMENQYMRFVADKIQVNGSRSYHRSLEDL